MVKEIPTKEVRQRIDAGESLCLLDVRRQEEWDEMNVPGAIHIPLDELEARLNELDAYRSTELIVYCRTGNRSSQACMLLDMFGFEHPVNMQGGVVLW